MKSFNTPYDVHNNIHYTFYTYLDNPLIAYGRKYILTIA